MIGILIVSHGAFGESLIHCASHVLGKRPLYLRQLGVTVHDDPDAILPVAAGPDPLPRPGRGRAGDDRHLRRHALEHRRAPARARAASRASPGVNLPMLIRALTYRDEPLEDVLAKALSGGTEGVMRMPRTA